VFNIWFYPTYITITKPGVYDYDVTVDPLYEKVGFVLSVDQNSLPENVHAMVMPPVGFFQYANDQNKTLKLTLIVGPKAEQGGHQILFNLTQIIPPYGKDEHVISGPYLNISFSQ
jgi:hypothetical protein